MKLSKATTSLTTVAIFLTFILFAAILGTHPLPDKRSTAKHLRFPRGRLHALLHRQNLSHGALHSPLRLHLAALFRSRAVAIVGVAAGHDVRSFASAGYRVHAIEPGTKYIRRLQADKMLHPWWALTVYPFAAAASSNARRSVNYLSEQVASEVTTRRVDELVTERLAVLSVDVQGVEAEVLRGASRLLPDKVDSLFVEINACYAETLEVFRLLDRDYVMFDFVPRGNLSVRNGLNELQHVYDQRRPERFEEYQKWLCERSREKFEWVQTDVMAVRRDLIGEVWKELGQMGVKYCGQQNIFCNVIA